MATDVMVRPETAVAASTKRTKRLLVSSPKGGSTKTSTVGNLAVIAALENFRVATADFDRQKTLTEWWALRPKKAVNITHYEVGFDQAADIAEIDDVDLVIIDTPPGIEDHPKEMRILVRNADFVIVPTLQNELDLKSVIPWMRYVRSEGAKAAFLIGAASRRTKSIEEARRKLIAVAPLCPIDVPRAEDVPTMLKRGLGVAEVRRAKAAEDFVGVWHFVRENLGLVRPEALEVV